MKIYSPWSSPDTHTSNYCMLLHSLSYSVWGSFMFWPHFGGNESVCCSQVSIMAKGHWIRAGYKVDELSLHQQVSLYTWVFVCKITVKNLDVNDVIIASARAVFMVPRMVHLLIWCSETALRMSRVVCLLQCCVVMSLACDVSVFLWVWTVSPRSLSVRYMALLTSGKVPTCSARRLWRYQQVHPGHVQLHPLT